MYIFIVSVHVVYVELYVGCGMHNLLVVCLTYTCDVCMCIVCICVYEVCSGCLWCIWYM